MINVVPPDLKQSIIYARRNSALINWVFAMLVGLVGVGLVVAAGFFYINQATALYEQQVSQKKDQLASQKLEETQKRADSISSSTQLALQVLSKQVKFSGLIQQIGAVMPTGSTLQSLNLGKVQGGIDLQAAARDYQTATQVQVNLQDKNNKIFEKADIVSISCADPSQSASTAYPCQITLRALFSDTNPYVVSTTKKAAQ